MQTLRQIRRMLEEAGLRPNKRLGQCFLIDKNLMSKLLDLADPSAGGTVLEVGPGTGSLTEGLLDRAGRVVAVEIDRGLAGLLRRRLGDRENLLLIHGDVLAGKRAIAPEILAALGKAADLVADLPYNIATPILACCLLNSWRALRGKGSQAACLFERLSFLVQRELAERLTAAVGSSAYGPISVLVALLGRLSGGPVVPASAFWPRPKVTGRIVRIDFDAAGARRLEDADVLTAVLELSFAQRRKQIGSIIRRKGAVFSPQALGAGLEAAGIERASRAQNIAPGQYLKLANVLAGR